MKFAPRFILFFSFVLLPLGLGCNADSGTGSGSGGHSSSGGTSAGTGGTASGGQTGSGGLSTGGTGTGTGGGAGTGGGNGTGGFATGGASSGTGGEATGGAATGGGGGATGSGGQNAGGAAGTTSGTGGRGAGGAAGAGTGGGGGGAFNPCPAAGTNCKIMPLGDSITFGSHSSGGGYRVELFRQSLMNSKKITFVGRNMNGPPTVTVNGTMTTFPPSHEGYSGYTIDNGGGRTGISSITNAALTAAKPNIVLLQIGTNDVNLDLDLGNAPTRLGNLMDRITSMVPNALLVVAKITPTMTDATNTRVRAYNDAIPGLIQTRVGQGKHIIMVDMYAAITANANYKTVWLDDDLHPNDAGYVVMGQTWYAGIKNYLP